MHTPDASLITLAAAAVLAAVTSSPAPAAPLRPSFQGLGFLPGGSSSVAYAISSDGSVVVGEGSTPSNPNPRAFRWTSAGGMRALGDFGGLQSHAFAVSGDGSTGVGIRGVYEAFRWTSAGGVQGLGLGVAFGASADGTVIVGGDPYVFRLTTAGASVSPRAVTYLGRPSTMARPLR